MELASVPVAYVVKMASVVKRIAYLIAVIGAVASYGTQVELVKSWGIESGFAYMIPATIDLLAICAAIGLQVPELPVQDRKLIGTIMVTALVTSISANIAAGHNAGARIAHAWPVVAYMLAELIANKLRTYVARVQAAQDAKRLAEQQEAQRIAAEAEAKAECSLEDQISEIINRPLRTRDKVLEIYRVAPHLTIQEIAAHASITPAWARKCLQAGTVSA